LNIAEHKLSSELRGERVAVPYTLEESRNMESFEELVKEAVEQLKHPSNNNQDTPMLRGIGYALLALAIAIRGEKDPKSSP